jgi:hypothetical protein
MVLATRTIGGPLLAVAAALLAVSTFAAQPPPAAPTLPGDFLERLATPDNTLRLTLPNGQPVIGRITTTERSPDGVTLLAGTLQHPEPGDFSFSQSGPATLTGTLRFTAQAVEWSIQPAAQAGTFHLVARPAADAFRPRDPKLPTAPADPAATPAAIRAAAEETLRKSLKLEEIAPGKLRLGQVEILRDARQIRIPATVNQREKVVEYALVTSTGKTHEALFTTTATPRDIHLAMLLLGVQPAPCVSGSDQSLTIPAAAQTRVVVEWDHAGSRHSRPLLELVSTREPDGPSQPLPDRPWHYNGSRFNQAGFAATLEGSIIALMADDLALLNNAGPDRASDDSHFPTTSLLPPAATPVTIVIATPLPASKPIPATP